MNKLVAFLLAGSLVLNAALLVLLAAGARTEAPAPDIAVGKPTRAAPATPVIDASVWPSLHASGDLPSLVQHLQEAGFPPAIVRAIVTAQLQEQFAARRKALDPGAESRPFWKNPTFDPAMEAAMRQLSREQRTALHALLGPDAESSHPMIRAREARMFGHLPPEKLDEARRIVSEFNELRNELFMSAGAGSGGLVTFTGTLSERINALDRQMNAEMRKIMSPREFEEYELRGSNAANSLRYQLSAFDATESEFRTLFQLQRDFNERHLPLSSPPSQEQIRARSEAQQQLNQQIKAALGPVRGAEYERATNYEYRTTSQLVARLQLPPETTNQLYAVQKEFEQRRNELYRSTSSAADRERMTEQLGLMQQEAVERVAPLLGGTRGVEAYKQYGGRWLENLVPRPPPSAALPRP